MTLRDIRLWLHDGTPEGARTAFEGSVFVSHLSADDGARLRLQPLGDREAVMVLTGPDAMPDTQLALVVSGVVSELLLANIPENARTPFTSITLLGAPGALQLTDAVRAAVAKSGRVVFLDGIEPTEAELVLPKAWTDLAAAVGGMPVWLSAVAEETSDGFGRAHAGMALFCTGRGADAKALLQRRGILVLKGSRCSSADATPSLIAPFRDVIKALVDRGELEKKDGVWTFVTDVRFSSPIQAASIIMRTSAGASAWVTVDGDTLQDRFRKA